MSFFIEWENRFFLFNKQQHYCYIRANPNVLTQ